MLKFVAQVAEETRLLLSSITLIGVLRRMSDELDINAPQAYLILSFGMISHVQILISNSNV